MTPRIRMTMPTLVVMEAIAQGFDGDVYGLLISQETGLGTGTVYPILERLEAAGMVEGRWEKEQPSGRPRRRFLSLTNLGRTTLENARATRAAKSRRSATSWVGGHQGA